MKNTSTKPSFFDKNKKEEAVSSTTTTISSKFFCSLCLDVHREAIEIKNYYKSLFQRSFFPLRNVKFVYSQSELSKLCFRARKSVFNQSEERMAIVHLTRSSSSRSSTTKLIRYQLCKGWWKIPCRKTRCKKKFF